MGSLEVGVTSICCSSCDTIIVILTPQTRGGVPSGLPCIVIQDDGFVCAGTMCGIKADLSQTDIAEYWNALGDAVQRAGGV